MSPQVGSINRLSPRVIIEVSGDANRAPRDMEDR
jgi:hypothetical protein